MLRHLSYANVTATLALFLALTTGGAYAATKLIASKDIKNNSITGTDIKDASIGPKDLSSAAKVSGPAGPKGDTGPAGANGANGADGIVKLKTAGSKISAGTVSLPFGLIANGACSTVVSSSLTLNEGDATIADDAVIASPKSPLPNGAVYSAAGSGTNQIAVTICNVSGGAIPASERAFNYTAADTN